jgi:phospholipase/lecithinase/hemolysin
VPPDVSTALFVVWASDADFVDLLLDNDYSPYNSNNIVIWTNTINRFLTNHSQIISNLYSKGVRTLMIPNAVDITLIPAYNAKAAADRAFIRQRIISFNSACDVVISNAMATFPGLTIYSPDILKVVDDVVAHAANYGLTNKQLSGHNVGVLGDPSMSPYLLNGPGTNYVFWDQWHPTAKFHMVIAEAMQRAVSPLQFTEIAAVGESNRLDVLNVPVGRRGFVEGSTNFVNWSTNFAGLTNAIVVNTNLATQSVFVPASGPMQFYRMTFPFVWTWP